MPPESLSPPPSTDTRPPTITGMRTKIQGANGDSVAGQAVLNFPGTFPNTFELVSNRDDLYFQSDYSFTPHITGLIGFRFMDERGADKSVAYAIDQTLERANYDYTAQVQGDFRNRVYYTLGGGVEKNQLYGTVGTPRIGVAYYPVRPGSGVLHGTKIKFNYSNGYQEPSLEDQFGSLYTFLLGQPGGAAAIQQFHVPQIGAEDLRAYDGGGEQSFLNQRGVIRATYFHNQFRNQVEAVPPTEVPTLLPNLGPAQQVALESFLMNGPGIALNSQSFRAQGVESEVEFTAPAQSLFARRLHLSRCGGAALVYLRCALTLLQHRSARRSGAALRERPHRRLRSSARGEALSPAAAHRFHQRELRRQDLVG